LLRIIHSEVVTDKLGIDIAKPKTNIKHIRPDPNSNPKNTGIKSIIFLSVAPKQVDPFGTLIYLPEVKIEGEDQYSFSLSEAPTGAKIDPQTGKVTWKPADGKLESLPNIALFTIVCEAAKGNVSARQSFKVEVGFQLVRRFSFNMSAADMVPTDVVVADLNDDGQLDVAIARGDYTRGRAEVYYRNTAASFSGSKEFTTDGQTTNLSVSDVNADKLPDLLALSRSNRRIDIFIQDTATRRLEHKPYTKEWYTGDYPLSMAIDKNNRPVVLAQDQGGMLFTYETTGELARSGVVTPSQVSVFTRLVRVGGEVLFVDLPVIGAATILNGKWENIGSIMPPIDILGKGERVILGGEDSVYLINTNDDKLIIEEKIPFSNKTACGLIPIESEGKLISNVLVVTEGREASVFIKLGGAWIKCPSVTLPSEPVLPAYMSSDGIVVLVLGNREVWGIGRMQ